MPRILKDLTITEVSSVDRGAGEGVHVLLMKRDVPVTKTGEIQMTDAELQAAIKKSAEDAAATVTATFTAELAKRDATIAVLKMSPTHKAYYDQCDEAAKKAFTEADDAEKDKMIADKPVKKAAEPVVQSQVTDLAKRLDDATAQNAELRKRLDAVDLEKAQADFVKRAAGLGLTQPGDGEIMRKAYAGDKDSQLAFEKRQAEVVTALNKQAETGKLFSEFGSSMAKQGSAYQSLVAKGEELRKSQPTLTVEQAFAKVYEDPANREMVALYKSEENRGQPQAAA